MTTTQRPTFTQRGGDGAGFFYLLAAGGVAPPSLNFDFTTGSLPAGITFTRVSIGTYNSSGNLLVTAGNDVARFNYVGGVANLLIEPSATNLVVQSNNFTTTWVAGNAAVVTGAQFISPDGANNGWTVTSGTGNGYVSTQNFAFSNSPYTVSVWVKTVGGNAQEDLHINGVDTIVNPTTTLARMSGTKTVSGTTGPTVLYTIAASGSTNGIYGAQVELGSKMTSYIPTTTAAVTRAADSAVFTIPSGINQLVYTFDDNSTQTVAVSPGSYTIPTTLNRPNIKSVVGSYAFDFTGGSLPAGMTFTRPSIGTYTNVSGTLITAGNDVARMNYVGGVACLLIEPSATNLLIQSNNFADSSWQYFMAYGVVITAAQFTSPDGTNNGWSMANGSAAFGQIGVRVTLSNIQYSMSIWAKQIIGTSPIGLYINDVNSGSTLPITGTITRISFTATPSAGVDVPAVLQIREPVSGKTDGIFGAQLETGSKMTSYIPTTTAPVTRAADAAVFTIPAGVGHLTYTFDDNSTQSVTVSAGSYTIPVTLNRPNIKSIVGSA